MDILAQLAQQGANRWLPGVDNSAFLALTQRLTASFEASGAAAIILVEPDPMRFLAGLLAAIASGKRLFLGNPQWGRGEWQQAWGIAQPADLWGSGVPAVTPWLPDHSLAPVSPAAVPGGGDRQILIPTGGSSGQIRFALHRWQGLEAAVWGFQQHFQLSAINSICVLPLHHVSGLMQGLRAFLSGGALWPMPFAALKAGQIPPVDPADWLISLVPTQLQALLEVPAMAPWLARCRAVYIGGGPTWPELLDRAQALGIPLVLCYGMTETAAQVTALPPEQFLQGDRSQGRPLPHARVRVVDDQGHPLPAGATGRVEIGADSLAWGYYPATPIGTGEPPHFLTDDAGWLDSRGQLTLVGRLSSKIITGGENVFPSEVEAALWATGLVGDVAVLGLPDPYWGQRIAAVYVPVAAATPADLCRALQGGLARYKWPKVWVPVSALPRNAQGKLNRKTLLALAIQDRPEDGRDRHKTQS